MIFIFDRTSNLMDLLIFNSKYLGLFFKTKIYIFTIIKTKTFIKFINLFKLIAINVLVLNLFIISLNYD